MALNQNETRGVGMRNSDCGIRNSRSRDAMHRAASPIRNAFTLTELLVVITIIAVLAGLATNAAINALNAGKRTVITLEIDQLATAMEKFKTDFGSYPPDVYPILDPNLSLSDPEKKTAANDLILFMKRAFNRGQEFQVNMSGSVPDRNAHAARLDNLFPLLKQGISPAEAIVFWLGGFSSDIARPLTGTDLTGSATTGVVTIDSRTPLFDFDRSRLSPTKTINLRDATGTDVTIQLYEYRPSGSVQPYVYFDTSRRTPLQTVRTFPHNPDAMLLPGHEFFYKPTTGEGCVVPLKKRLSDAPNVPTLLAQIEYVNQRKFQILHCGIDDEWGNNCYSVDTSQILSQLDNTNIPTLFYPEGPFIGDIADTLSNFTTGTLEAAQE